MISLSRVGNSDLPVDKISTRVLLKPLDKPVSFHARWQDLRRIMSSSDQWREKRRNCIDLWQHRTWLKLMRLNYQPTHLLSIGIVNVHCKIRNMSTKYNADICRYKWAKFNHQSDRIISHVSLWPCECRDSWISITSAPNMPLTLQTH